MEVDWFVKIIDFLLIFGAGLYMLFDLLPDSIKWLIIILMFVPYLYWIYDFIHEIIYNIINNSFSFILDSILNNFIGKSVWTILVIGMCIKYFKTEVNATIGVWIINIPDKTYDYIIENPYISGFTLLVSIFIISLFFEDSISSGSDNDSDFKTYSRSTPKIKDLFYDKPRGMVGK